ncbi:hypothetical protein CPB83DRAFT_858841 [Crepidotus variabilis]|uniref:Uncharacterized protein n=1 Tax=Crepidotus variabilis TaxID=179855 RepID=A0A9P6EBB7_9AGAR|nr:hypothetical protein CPB83DRAFT_858841 [Crepidotus variabilis]
MHCFFSAAKCDKFPGQHFSRRWLRRQSSTREYLRKALLQRIQLSKVSVLLRRRFCLFAGFFSCTQPYLRDVDKKAIWKATKYIESDRAEE